MKTHCPDPKGNEICTNGKDTYHEFNMREFGCCNFCSPTEPVKEDNLLNLPDFPNKENLPLVHRDVAINFFNSLLLSIEEKIKSKKTPKQGAEYDCCNWAENDGFNRGLQVALGVIKKFKE